VKAARPRYRRPPNFSWRRGRHRAACRYRARGARLWITGQLQPMNQVATKQLIVTVL